MSFFPAQGKGEGHHSLPCCEGHHNSESVMIPFHSQHTQPPPPNSLLFGVLSVETIRVQRPSARSPEGLRPKVPKRPIRLVEEGLKSDWG